MVIKSSSEYKILVSILLACVGFSVIIFVVEFGAVFFSLVVGFLLVLFVIRYWVSVCRTYVLSAEGCTIEFLSFKKTYKWEEFRTMRIEDYSGRLGYKLHYTSGIVLSSKKIKRKTKYMPAMYSLFFHPFSLVYIHFDPHIEFGKWDVRCPDLYVVEETALMKHLKKWGVEPEDDRHKT